MPIHKIMTMTGIFILTAGLFRLSADPIDCGRYDHERDVAARALADFDNGPAGQFPTKDYDALLIQIDSVNSTISASNTQINSQTKTMVEVKGNYDKVATAIITEGGRAASLRRDAEGYRAMGQNQKANQLEGRARDIDKANSQRQAENAKRADRISFLRNSIQAAQSTLKGSQVTLDALMQKKNQMDQENADLLAKRRPFKEAFDRASMNFQLCVGYQCKTQAYDEMFQTAQLIKAGNYNCNVDALPADATDCMKMGRADALKALCP